MVKFGGRRQPGHVRSKIVRSRVRRELRRQHGGKSRSGRSVLRQQMCKTALVQDFLTVQGNLDESWKALVGALI